MTDAPRRHTRQQLEQLLDLQAQKIEYLEGKVLSIEAELRAERFQQKAKATRASYGNGAIQ